VNGNVSARGLVKGAGNEVERRVELLSLLPQHGERTVPGNWGPRKGRQAGRAATQFPRVTIDINHQPVELQAVKELLIVGELSVLSCPVLGVNKFSLCFVAAHALVSWLALLLVTGGLWANWRTVAPPLLLAGPAFAASLFTVSDLFVTHYALLQPVLVATVAVAAAALLERAGRLATTPGLALRWTVVGLLVLWLALDLANVVRYHAALGRSGGLADHSDASYHLAYHLRYNGMGAPIALDWGMDAPVRYLTNGTVTPIEIFGYASPAAPDDQFLARLAPFLANPDNRYLLHAPAATVFAGRREAFLAAVAALSGRAILEQQFAQRDGAPLYEIWRVEGSQ
jgi:hypothetical protein